jgi:2-dehydro-3-deoxygluconokinase
MGSETVDVVTFGEPLGLLLADDSLPLRRARAFRRTVAGAELNTAVGLARLGHRCALAARVGDDPFGDDVRATLAAESVAARPLLVDDGAATGLITRDRSGHRRVRVVYHRVGSAGSRLSAADLDALPIEAARVLHVTGITPALSATALAATRAAIVRAQAAGVAISFDPNFRARLWSRADAAPELRELAAQARIVLASEDEARWLAGLEEARGAGASAQLPEVAEWFHARGAELVAIKRGAAGAWVSDGTTATAIASVPVGAAVDPVGAGDAFDAGFLSGWLDGRGAVDAARRGAACGAACVQVAGDLDGLPTRAELDDMTTTEVDR